VNVQAVQHPPWQVERRWLGYAGLLPFIGCLAVMLGAEQARHVEIAADLLRHYAALIASFLGAVHWGAAAAAGPASQRARLRWGIAPAVLAWGLLAVPPPVAFAGLALLFLLLLVVDCYLLPALDADYRRLRLVLSLVVIATLAAAAWATPPA